MNTKLIRDEGQSNVNLLQQTIHYLKRSCEIMGEIKWNLLLRGVT